MDFLTTFLYSQFFVTPKYPEHDFSGQTVIVTGSNGGLGFEAAQHIVRLNAAKVIIACRTLPKGEEAKEKILSSTKRKDDCIEVWKLNLSATESVKEFAKQAEALDRLDAVIENAGVSNEDWRFEGDIEQTIQVNVISTILLALLLLPKLRETAQKYATTSHLEIVTSEMHQMTKFEAGKTGNVYERLAEEAYKGNGQSERYPISKLMEILFVQELVNHTNNNPIITLVNPGFCWSGLVKFDNIFKRYFLNFWRIILCRTTEVGSRTLVAGIVAGPESHGKYMSDGVNQDHGIAKWIWAPEGRAIQKRVYDQTVALLEKIQPGISNNV